MDHKFKAQQVAGSMLLHSTENASSIDLDVIEGIISGRLDSVQMRADLVEKFMSGTKLGSSTRLIPMVIPKQITLGDFERGCPKCGSTSLVRLSSQDLKLCAGCGASFSWTLKPWEVKTV